MSMQFAGLIHYSYTFGPTSYHKQHCEYPIYLIPVSLSFAEQVQSLEKKAKLMDVTKYLEYLKQDRYIKLFVDEGVDGSLLWGMCHAEEDEFKDLGIENGFHRRKIKNKLEEYLQTL